MEREQHDQQQYIEKEGRNTSTAEAAPVMGRPSLDTLVSSYAGNMRSRAEQSTKQADELRRLIEAKATLQADATNEREALHKAEIESQADQLFDREFTQFLPQVLGLEIPQAEGKSVTLGELLRHGIDQIGDSTGEGKIVAQKELVASLVSAMEKMNSGTWAISMRQTAENGQTNCSEAASIFTVALDSVRDQTGIPTVDYVNPYGHAMAMVRFEDGSLYAADPRNGVFKDVTQQVDVEEREDLRVYGLRELDDRIPFHYLPTTKSLRNMVTGNYAGNMAEVPDAADGIFDEVLMNASTEEERQLMQLEAQQVRNATGLTREQSQSLLALNRKLLQPLLAFRDSPSFRQESSLWQEIRSAQDTLNVIGERLQTNSALLENVRNGKGALREFLLGNTDELSLGDDETEQLLIQYRKAKQMQHTIIHKAPEAWQAEVDQLLAKI